MPTLWTAGWPRVLMIGPAKYHARPPTVSRSSLMRSRCFALLVAGVVGVLPAAWAADAPAAADAQDKKDKKVDFARDVRPILAAHCWSCHGEKASEGGLRLHTRKTALAGGDSGKAILPGKSRESRLIKYVTGKNDAGIRMPPETVGE